MSDAVKEMAIKIMRNDVPATLGGIFDCAVARGCDYEDAWKVVDFHYKNYGNPDYDAAAGITERNRHDQ